MTPTRAVQLLALILSLGGCRSAPPADPAREPVGVRPRSHSTFGWGAPTGGTDPTDSILRIPLRNGDTAVFVGHPFAEEGTKRFAYDGHLEGAPFHGVSVSYYEASAYILVHDSTGQRFTVDARPVVSPDGKEIVVASFGVESDNVPNSLTVLRLDRDSLAVEWREIPGEWGPKDPVWFGKDTVSFRQSWPGARGRPGTGRPALLTRQHAKWVLSPDLDPSAAAASISDPDLMVAGVAYKDDSSVVRRRLGDPDSVATGVWYYRDLTVYLKEEAQVEQILLRTRRYATRRGLRVGDDISRAADLYGGGGWGDEEALVYNHAADQQDFDERGMIVERDGTRITGIRLGAVQTAE